MHKLVNLDICWLEINLPYPPTQQNCTKSCLKHCIYLHEVFKLRGTIKQLIVEQSLKVPHV